MTLKEEILKEWDKLSPQLIHGRRLPKQVKKFISDAIDRVNNWHKVFDDCSQIVTDKINYVKELKEKHSRAVWLKGHSNSEVEMLEEQIESAKKQAQHALLVLQEHSKENPYIKKD